MHTPRYLRVDSVACYITEGELLRIWPSGWLLLTPSWWDSQINTLLTSNLHFPGRKIHTNTAWTHTRWPSKSSLILPMVLHDRLLAALRNTHTKPNQTRMHTQTRSLVHTGWGLSPQSSQCIELSQRASPQGPREESRAHNTGHLWNWAGLV